MKGILIEKKNRKSVVMDEKGRFLQTRTDKKWNEGETVEFAPPAAMAAKRLSVAAVFLLIAALSVFSIYMTNTYTVNMDVNPSIEIKTGPFNNVTEVSGVNDDARTIEGLGGAVGMKIGPAVNYLINIMKETGYLQDDGTVVLSIEGKNGKVRTVIRELSEAIPEAEIEGEGIPDEEDESEKPDNFGIYVSRLTEETKQKAEELDVPVGRIVLAEKAIHEGASISYDMVKVLSIQEIQDIRGVAKSLEKAGEIIERAAESEEDERDINLNRVEALADQIQRRAERIEEAVNKLQEKIQEGKADENDIFRHGVLSGQFGEIMEKIDDVKERVEKETNDIMGNQQGNDSKPDKDKQEADNPNATTKEEIEERKEKVKKRVEQKIEEVRTKIEVLRNTKGKIPVENNGKSDDNGNSNGNTSNPGKRNK